MKANSEFTIGLVLCLILVGINGYLVYTAYAEPAKNKPAVLKPPYDDKLFQDQLFTRLKLKTINGALPFSVNDGETGKENPFE